MTYCYMSESLISRSCFFDDSLRSYNSNEKVKGNERMAGNRLREIGCSSLIFPGTEQRSILLEFDSQKFMRT